MNETVIGQMRAEDKFLFNIYHLKYFETDNCKTVAEYNTFRDKF